MPYFLKEILSESELELFLRLRYSEFCNSPASVVVMKNNKEIDINYYDRNSMHYGIYKQQNERAAPVGYFRIVLEEPAIADKWVTNISEKSGLTNVTEHKPQTVFPCMGIYPYQNLEQEFYKKKTPFERAGEVSRFFIIQSERSVRLSLQIIRSSFAIALLHIQHAFVGCFSDHSQVYMKLGFKPCPGSSIFSFKSTGKQKEGIILYCSADYLSGEVHSKLKIMQGQFLLNKRLTF